MERKLHTSLDFNSEFAQITQKYKMIRSAELMYLAFKKNLLDLENDVETLDAVLYSLKFNGTAISSEEIEEIKRLTKK